MTQSVGGGIPFPFLFFGVLLAAAALSYLLRRWARLVASVGALSAALLAVLIWQIDFERPLWVLPAGLIMDFGGPLAMAGYTFLLQATNAAFVTASLIIAALALTLAAVVDLDDALPSLIWMLTAGYAAVLLLEAAPLAPLFVVPLALLALAALSTFALQGGRRADPAGPLRLLFPPLLAAPLFILAAWYLDSIALNPQDVAGIQAAGLLLGFGLLLLLAPFPLHGAIPDSARTAPPPAFLLVVLLNELAVLHLTGQTLATYPLILRQTDWSLWVGLLGLLTAVWGGLAALGALSTGRLWGYAALLDWGFILLVVAAPDQRGWTLVVLLFVLRSISMFTVAASLTAFQQVLGTLDMQALRGVGARMPWNSAAFLLGGLGLVGFPLTAGFAGHWAVLQLLAETDWRTATIVVAASAGALLGFVRVARLMFGPLGNRALTRERTATIVVAVASLIVTVSVAVSPQLVDEFLRRALAAFG